MKKLPISIRPTLLLTTLVGDSRLRERLARPGIVVAPGAYDMMSLLVANQIGFEAIFASGYWVMASQLGLPDAGIASYRDFETAFRRIVEFSDAPVIADADTGFGGTVNIDHAVRGYLKMGCAAIQIEDQCFPKQCGHVGPRAVVDTQVMTNRIATARAALGGEDMLIVARTDARGSEGFDEALRRMNAYAEAGADILFLEGPHDEEEMSRFCAELPEHSKLVNAAHGGKTPILPPQQYEKIGYGVAIYPGGAAMCALAAARDFLMGLKQGDARGDCAGMYPFASVSKLLGFDKVKELELAFGTGE